MEAGNEPVARPRGARPSAGSALPNRPAPSSRAASPLEELEHRSDPFAGVKQWIRQNQTLAVLSGFALGVVIGVMMRG